MKKLLIGLAVVAAVVGFGGKAEAAARDCDANAIMWCGAYSKSELLNKLAKGDGHNSAANIQGIFRAYSVDLAEINAATNGSVTKDGKVIVNGATVATGAKSIGRQKIGDSVPQNGVWLRPTSTSFKSPSLEAYVYMKDGVFQWAVLKSCGNITIATPVPKPKPKPVPVTPAAPTPTPTPTPQPIPEIVPSTPVLPETGMEIPLAGAALGTTSVGYGLRGYLRSKKNLASALRNK